MKDNLTEIVVILDQSGSMSVVAKDTIGSFNTFIEDQKNAPGEANFTLVLFASHGEQKTVANAVPIAEAKKLTSKTYKPDGMTALLDAVASTIDMVGMRLAVIDEADRPSKVIVCIITDGEENHSRNFSKDAVKERITHQIEKYNWQFVYLGANQDSFAEARNIGINNASNFAHNSQGLQQMTCGINNLIRSYRDTGALDMKNYNTENK